MKVQALKSSVTDGPKIRPGDNAALLALSDKIENCCWAMSELRSYELDCTTNLRHIYDRLPGHLQGKWRKTAMLCRERSGGREPDLKELSKFGIYTLSDLGDLSNLIGSLYRTIQQYSPPSEWIMCKLAIFPIFLENDLLKVDKILGLTFFRQENTSKDSKRRFSIYCN